MTTKLPIACTLSPEDLRARRNELLPGLADRAVAHERVDGGIRLQFSSAPDILTTLARAVDAERQCCRFLGFAIAMEPNLGPITLTVTAPPEAQELLADLIQFDRG